MKATCQGLELLLKYEAFVPSVSSPVTSSLFKRGGTVEMELINIYLQEVAMFCYAPSSFYTKYSYYSRM